MASSTQTESPQQSQPANLPAEIPTNRITLRDTGVRFESFAALVQFADCVVKSGFAPKGMEKISSVVVAIQQGLEIGLPPMAALQNIAVINGRPSIFGDAALAVVRNSGLLDTFEERPGRWCHLCEREIVENKCDQCGTLHKPEDSRAFICIAKRRDQRHPTISGFSVVQAKQAGLWGKAGPWTQYPQRMLRFRARGFCLRDGFGDVLKGLRSAEEQADMPGAQTVDAPSLPTNRVRLGHEGNGTTAGQEQVKDIEPDVAIEPTATETPQAPPENMDADTPPEAEMRQVSQTTATKDRRKF